MGQGSCRVPSYETCGQGYTSEGSNERRGRGREAAQGGMGSKQRQQKGREAAMAV